MDKNSRIFHHATTPAIKLDWIYHYWYSAKHYTIKLERWSGKVNIALMLALGKRKNNSTANVPTFTVFAKYFSP